MAAEPCTSAAARVLGGRQRLVPSRQRRLSRMTKRWPNALLVQLPVHAWWLNQVEIYFSVIQRKVLTPNDFADLAEVESRLAAFERRYERAAEPFEWRFTRDDLALLMNKLADRPDDLAA